MNTTLARLAARRAADGIGPQRDTYCQMWVRLTVQALYGSKWDRWLWKGSARLAGLAFRHGATHHELPDNATVIQSGKVNQTQVGDILYAVDGHGEDGHVSIRCEGNQVAENSSVHAGINGAIGFRPLSAVTWDTIVRLPDPMPHVATPRELLAEVYSQAHDDAAILAALNRFRWNDQVADFLEK